MPWSPSDADRHKKGLGPKQKALWARLANETLEREQEKGTGRKEAEARAIRAANAAAGRLREDRMPDPAQYYKVRVRKANFRGYRSADVPLTEGAKAIIGIREDGTEALQSMQFDRAEWPVPEAARTWISENKAQLEELAAGGDEIDLSEDVFRPGEFKVDREAGILREAKLLGALSANGHRYSDQALEEAAELYRAGGGVKVNLDHPERKNPDAPRRVGERWGKIDPASVKTVKGVGDFGDVIFNPKHPLTESILWFAEHMPDALGFSHNGRGRLSGTGRNATVESVRVIRHVDLVSDPATTTGLFESLAALTGGDLEIEEELVLEDGEDGLTEGADMDWTKVDLMELRKERPDLVDKILTEDKSRQESEKELKTLREERDKYKKRADEADALEALGKKKEKADALITEAKLPKEAVTEPFLESLLGAKDEDAMKALVEDRQKLVLTGKPRSRERALAEGASGKKLGDTSTSKSFAQAVRG